MKSLVFFGRAYFFNSVFHQSTFSIVSSSLYKCFQQRSNPEKSVILIKLTVGFHLVCEHHQSRRLLNNEDINSRDSRETFCFVMIERHQVAEMTYCEFKYHKPKLRPDWHEVLFLLSISSANILNHSGHLSEPQFASEMKYEPFYCGVKHF